MLTDPRIFGRRRCTRRSTLGSLSAALALTLLGSTSSWGEPASTDEQVQFAVNVEKLKGHLLASQELYAKGEEAFAAIHAAHPVQELWEHLRGPLDRIGGDFAKRAGALLERPGREIDSKVSKKRYAETVKQVFGTLDDAVSQVVPTKIRRSLAFRIQVIRELLAEIQAEYEEAFKEGKSAEVVEYQDAYGFFRRARALYQEVAKDVRRESAKAATTIERAFTTLTRAFKGVLPPETPMAATKVKEEVENASAALSKLPGG